MKKFLVSMILLSLAPAFGAEALDAQKSPERFKAADAAFRDRVNEASARLALDLYRKLRDETPRDVASLWRLSMACHYVGMRLTKEKDDKKPFFTEGREAGLTAVEIDPGCAACRFWAAINMALYADAAGIFKMLTSLTAVRENLKLSAELDPAYAYGGAYRVLGRIEEKLPGILGGSDDRAKEYYEKAIAAAPDEPINYLFLARLLKESFSDAKAAMPLVDKGLSFPLPGTERVESREAYGELKDLKVALVAALETKP